MDILVSFVLWTVTSTSRVGPLAGPVLAVLGALLAGYAGWQLTDRLIAWRQDAD
ncbi:hypothetical protein [Actinomadura sp. HBU206391]|uniref:hypothetical protein n=1 Tax=Actinomadura sp. HBU206391 TaxID=2731692 RepID=UPI001650CE0A|nr:hypothetical protein [Actinomadura sp. HBU206391]MBC6456887.1 hypothetical protein [Actinomadura sp. HBU206391]